LDDDDLEDYPGIDGKVYQIRDDKAEVQEILLKIKEETKKEEAHIISVRNGSRGSMGLGGSWRGRSYNYDREFCLAELKAASKDF
jgi:hypothetical protein